MFYQLHSPIEIILLAIGLAAFGLIAWWRPNWGAALVLFLAPFYLLKIKIGWLPMNVLEILIWLLAALWGVKKTRVYCHSGFEPPACRRGRKSGRKTLVVIPSLFRDLKELLKQAQRDGGGFLYPILLILAGVFISTLFSFDLKISAGIFRAYFLAPMVFAWILLDIIKTKEQFKKNILAIVFSSLAVALVGLCYLLSGKLTFDGRLFAFYLSPNHSAMYLAPGFLLALAFWSLAKKNWQKGLLTFGYLLLAVILYFTFSYAAWLAILAAVGLYFFVNYAAGLSFPRKRESTSRLTDNAIDSRFRGNDSIKKLFAVCCLLFAVLLLLFFSQWQSQKLADLLKFNHSSIESRLMVWSAAKEILKDNWLFGVGPGMFQQKYLEYQNHFATSYFEWAVPQPHNIFLAFWLQAGLIGLAGFIWLIIVFFIQAAKNLKTKQPLAFMLAAVMMCFLAHGLVDTTYWKNDLSLIFWVIVVLNYKASHLFYQ